MHSTVTNTKKCRLLSINQIKNTEIMKTTEPKQNDIKSFSKNGTAFLFTVLFTLSISAKINIDTLKNSVNIEKHKLEKALINNLENSDSENLDISEIKVIVLEEEVELDGNTSNYLPENFNALKGKNDLDWNTIEVFEIEEEVELGFDTSKYLPENFNALKGRNNLDWDTIEIIELEEEVELDFDTSKHLPQHFNALKGKNDLDWSTIALIEIEEDIEINFDTKAYLPQGFNPYQGMATHNTDIVVIH